MFSYSLSALFFLWIYNIYTFVLNFLNIVSRNQDFSWHTEDQSITFEELFKLFFLSP